VKNCLIKGIVHFEIIFDMF